MKARLSVGWVWVVVSLLIRTPPARGDVPADHNKTEPPPVQVLVTKVPQTGRVVYRYCLVNGSAFPITSLWVGCHGLLSPELPMFDDAVPSGEETSPRGWHFDVVPTEEDSVGSIEWEIDEQKDELQGGGKLEGFSVPLPAEDSNYEQGHWTVILDGASRTEYSGDLEPDAGNSAPPSSLFGQSEVSVTPSSARGPITISFPAPARGHATITLFDIHGRRVACALEQRVSSGRISAIWDGRDASGATAAPGTYFFCIETWMIVAAPRPTDLPTTERFARITWMK
jgi:hypothetical protein